MCIIIDPIIPPPDALFDKFGPLSTKHKDVIAKFGPNPGLNIKVQQNGRLAFETKIVPQIHMYNDKEEQDSDKFGASEEEIFFLKAFAQWRKLVGAAAVSNAMTREDVVKLENRPDWKERMEALNKSIQQVKEEATKFYQYVDQTWDKSVAIVERTSTDTEYKSEEK